MLIFLKSLSLFGADAHLSEAVVCISLPFTVGIYILVVPSMSKAKPPPTIIPRSISPKAFICPSWLRRLRGRDTSTSTNLLPQELLEEELLLGAPG